MLAAVPCVMGPEEVTCKGRSTPLLMVQTSKHTTELNRIFDGLQWALQAR